MGRYCYIPGSLHVRNDEPCLATAVIEQFGGFFEHVEIRCDVKWESYENHVLITEQLSRHSVGLKSVSLLGSPERANSLDIAVKHKASLEKLRICMQDVVYVGPPITFPGIQLPELRTLILQDRHLNDANELTSILTTSGGKLEHVVIDCWKGRAAEWLVPIDALRTTCRNLRKLFRDSDEITFKSRSNVPEAEEKRLLISYGSQQQEAELIHFPNVRLEEILSQYPNFRC